MNNSTNTRSFITEDFLLQSNFARMLYHDYAKQLPIIDYHCHLSPQEIAENRQFKNISQVWLEGDHYKWRAMRTLGMDERFITGDASDQEKFDKWAETVPFTVRNPLYHWTHLELERYFGITDLLNPQSAKAIYDHCSATLNTEAYRVQGLLQKMNVETVCSTDDPVDDLAFHSAYAKSNKNIKMLPAFRPDKAFAIEAPKAYRYYLDKLAKTVAFDINSFDTLIAALQNRIDYFHHHGCRLSDHGLEHMYFDENENRFNENKLFQKVVNGETLGVQETHFFKYKVLLALGKMYHAKGWVQQFHLGALRNTNMRMLHKLGPDTGFDSIGDYAQSVALAGYLNALDSSDQLSKTIIYNLNPADNEVMGTMIGNFNDGSVKGKIQFGSAWWFLDQKDGMQKQLNALSNMGLLSCFIGMLTDSRSFMSFPRHEYFRRILCNIIGNDVENGELPADEQWLGKIVSDICYHNAKNYFEF